MNGNIIIEENVAMRKKWCRMAMVSIIAIGCVTGCKGQGNDETNEETKETEPVRIETEAIVVEKSEKGNPIGGFDASGNRVYGGDPAALVVGDTVYLYTGHDTSTGDNYVIPEWQCYSSKDMVNWTYEGVVLKCKDIAWADKNSAWAGQVAMHYDETTGKDKYYFYYCSWDSTAKGKQSIGVAVAESPTGPFTDIGQSLVKGTFTEGSASDWSDIDPTIWIENDANGVEHRYLAWGNGNYYICELNEDMISVKDLDGNGTIEYGKDVLEKKAPKSFTEAPWIYRQKDEKGNYTGPYYLFYAYGWREEMAYATTDDLINGEWQFGDIIMEPTATSNTNHMSVIDFNGKTYYIYHNGSLTGGSGYRRVACVSELIFGENGKVEYITETSTGISGTASYLENVDGEKVAHYHFENSSSDTAYPYEGILAGTTMEEVTDEDMKWEIVPGLQDKTNENYVSIEAYNKPGLYLTAIKDEGVRLYQDAYDVLAMKQTFKTVKGLNGEGVSFESVAYPGYFIAVNEDGELILGNGSDKEACTFNIK